MRLRYRLKKKKKTLLLKIKYILINFEIFIHLCMRLQLLLHQTLRYTYRFKEYVAINIAKEIVFFDKT